MEEREYTYRINENGYDIFINGELVITQPEPYAHLYFPEGTYEENALAHIEELKRPPLPTEEERLRADLDFMALMMDVNLPSNEEV